MPEPDTSKKPTNIGQIITSLLQGVQQNMPGPHQTSGMMMPAHVGQIGQPFSPTLPSGLKLPSVAAPMGMPSGTQISPMQPTNGMERFSFPDAKARDAAVASNALQGLSQVVTQFKNRQEEKTRSKAEGYMSQIIAAQQSGDQQALNLLLEDPKVIKTLEKGLNYFLPKVPGEAPTPESVGVHNAIKKAQSRLPAPNTPGGVSIPRMGEAQVATQEAQRLAAVAALKKLQQDPELAAQQGLGTALSGAERHQAERFASSLEMTPAQESQLTMEDRKSLQAFDMFKQSQEEKLKEAAMYVHGQKEVAIIHSGPLYERARIARDLGLAQVKMRQQVAKGKMGDAVKTAMQTLSSQINTLRNLAEKAKKDGNDDQASEYQKEADDTQKQYNEVRKSAQYNIDDIIKEVLGDQQPQ